MLHPDSSSADINRLSLTIEASSIKPQYVWSPEDQEICTIVFQAAATAGVPISGDCARAVERADNPDNRVDLSGVVLAELGNNDFLIDSKNRGIALLAASLFQTSPNASLQIAGRSLSERVALADKQVPYFTHTRLSLQGLVG